MVGDMAKTGRNDPCPCGSGKKYKKCCLAKDEEAHRQRQAIAAAAIEPADDHHGFCDECYDQLAEASNAVVDLVDAGKLDEAEQAAHALLERFPDVHDGYARLGLVYEVKGDAQQAIHYYRKVIDFAREHPDAYEPVFEADYQQLIDRLESSAPAV
jgi:tetratricopeptide (TPR) repeat protein